MVEEFFKNFVNFVLAPPPKVPTLAPGEVCAKSGAECVYGNDGNIKINCMDMEAGGAVCAPGLVTKYEVDAKNRKRTCCEPGTGPKIPNLPPLCASPCAMSDDGMPLKWSVVNYSPAFICKPGYTLEKFTMAEGEKCCCLLITTTTTTTTSKWTDLRHFSIHL